MYGITGPGAEIYTYLQEGGLWIEKQWRWCSSGGMVRNRGKAKREEIDGLFAANLPTSQFG